MYRIVLKEFPSHIVGEPLQFQIVSDVMITLLLTCSAFYDSHEILHKISLFSIEKQNN